MKRAHWWGDGSKPALRGAMKIWFPPGHSIKTDPRYPDTFIRAAFNYELEARVKQRDEGSANPKYRFGVAFPKLTREQKDELKTEYPRKDIQPWPQVTETRAEQAKRIAHYSAEERNGILATINELEAKKIEDGWIHFECFFNPATMDTEHLKKAVTLHVAAESKRRGLWKHTPKAGLRLKSYPWKMLAVIDQKLSGVKLGENSRTQANEVLRNFSAGKY